MVDKDDIDKIIAEAQELHNARKPLLEAYEAGYNKMRLKLDKLTVMIEEIKLTNPCPEGSDEWIAFNNGVVDCVSDNLELD